MADVDNSLCAFGVASLGVFVRDALDLLSQVIGAKQLRCSSVKVRKLADSSWATTDFSEDQ